MKFNRRTEKEMEVRKAFLHEYFIIGCLMQYSWIGIPFEKCKFAQGSDLT
jgi:hypothetical protein